MLIDHKQIQHEIVMLQNYLTDRKLNMLERKVLLQFVLDIILIAPAFVKDDYDKRIVS